jgi:hypothetical protein
MATTVLDKHSHFGKELYALSDFREALWLIRFAARSYTSIVLRQIYLR